VRPEARRQGVAVQLLDAARARVTEQGARSVALWVTDENPGARAFYEAYGFRRTDVTGALPPGRTGLQQELRLDLEEG
jgi:ribosomal protein S18 acetylase RimI-like enzyme